jgi:hypothetical protein
MTLFEDDGDYAAFERVLAQVSARVSILVQGTIH